MTWGLDVARRMGGGRFHGSVWLALICAHTVMWAPPLSAAESLSDAAHFSLTSQALYAAASAPRPADGTAVSLVEVQETYSYAADGSNVYTQYFVYKVLSPAGADSDWNELSIYWSPWHEDKPTMRARVVTADGSAYTLDPKTIADAPAHSVDSTYSDERALRAPLPAIAAGAVVETEIVMKERLPFAGAGTVRKSFLQLSAPIQHVRLTLEAPDSIALRYRVDSAPGLAPTHSSEAGRQHWVFNAGPTPAFEDYFDNAPGDVHQYPTVTFSTGASWQVLAHAYTTIVSERLANANIDELAARLTKGRSTRDAKVAALVEYLNREIRYTGIEFNESSVIPHTPAETLGRKYGDCKDKALLLVALLRASGVPANLALLNANSGPDVTSDLPGMGLFNHAIVHVPGEPAFWIDATAESARLGQLPDEDGGRFALIVDAQTTALTRIPDARSADNVLDETREVRLADYGPAAVTEVSVPHGNYEAFYRSSYADVKAKATLEALTDYVKAEYVAEKLAKADRSDPKDFSQPFRLTLESTKARRGYTSLQDAQLYIPIDGLFNLLPNDVRTREPTDEENAKATHPTKKRSIDYLLPRPFSVQWHYRIVPPPGFQAGKLPENSARALGPAQFSEAFSLDPDGSVRAELRFDTRQRRFTAAEQREMREQVATLRNREPIPIKFDLRAHSLLTQGQARDSFQAYRSLIADRPKDPIQHLRRANGLIEAGMGDAARAAVSTAIKLDPKRSLGFQMQATILQYDLIGRWHLEGADMAGAAAAYRTAISLDHDDRSLIANYAILLEHDKRGLRYGPGADLKAAIAAYRQLTSDERRDLGIAPNLSLALFYDGQYAAAAEEANSLESPPLALLIAVDAQLNGAPHAIAEAQRRGKADMSVDQIAAGAGSMLMKRREYSKAAALLEAGASGASTAQTLALVSTLRQTKRYEELPPLSGPEGLVRQSFLAVLKGGDGFSALDALRGEKWRGERALLSPEHRQMEEKNVGAIRSMALRSGTPEDVLIDISLPNMQLKTVGDDANGYRIVFQMPGMTTQTMFVSKEASGQYRLLASSVWPVPLATEVVERVQRGDVTSAALLLGWLRESIVQNEGGAEDPYAVNPFIRFWAQGQRQGDAQAIRLAAASIWVTGEGSAQRGLAILNEARAGATDAQAEAIDLARVLGYEQLHDHEHALELANALAQRTPLSRRAFYGRAVHLRALGRFKEADAVAEERLRSLPDDIDALRTLAENANASHDYTAARARGLAVLGSARSTPSDSNSVAWASLFFDLESGPDVETATRAVRGRENGGPAGAALHTLGCVYAEEGKTREAREVLLQSMTLRGITEPNGDYWYAFGRIAEQYGEREIALADYAKVKAPEDAALTYTSSYALAQKRVKVLGAR